MTVCPLCAITAAMGAPSLPKPTIDSLMRSLFLPDDRHPPTRAKGARCHLQNGCCLLPLELRDAYQFQNPAHRLFIVALRDDLLGAHRLLDMQLENFIED